MEPYISVIIVKNRIAIKILFNDKSNERKILQ